MELTNPVYPKRAVIQCKAKIRLLADPEVGLRAMPLDEALFIDIAKTLFKVDRVPELYEPSSSKRVACVIENHLATELVKTYKQIKLRQQDWIVQSLNALL